MQAHLLKYSDKVFISLTNYLFEVSEKCSIESVHKLRLTIKKLYTVVGFLDCIKEIPSLNKDLKVLNSIYLKAGIIRDNHVQIQLLNHYKDLVNEECEFIIEKIKNDNRKYKYILRTKIKRVNTFDLVLLHQRIDELIESLSDSNAEKIMELKARDLFNQINTIIKSNPDAKALHQIRIMLKELVYILSLLGKGNRNYKFDTQILVYLKKNQQALGEWHDLKVLAERVNCIKTKSAKLIDSINHNKNEKLAIVINELNDFERICFQV